MALTPPVYTPNPYCVYLWLRVGGKEVTVFSDGRPKSLVSFSHQKSLDNQANSLKIVLFDPKWTEIEEILVNNGNVTPVEVEYGYTEGLRSPTYSFRIMGYTPTFKIDGVELSLELLSSGIKAQPDATDRQRSEYWTGKLISEIVEEICTRNGWTPEVDKTKQVLDNHDLQTSGIVDAHWTQTKLTDLQFIKQVLRPRAIRASDGVGGYLVWIDDATNTLHFHPPRLEASVKKVYTFRQDRMSEVIRFSPEVNASLRLTQGAGVTASPYIDVQNGTYDNAESHDKTTPNKVLLGGNQTVTAAPNRELYHVSDPRPVRDKEQALDISTNRFMDGFNKVYGGQLVVQGDPSIETGSNIRVIVFLPDGKTHYTSGPYQVMGVQDDVSGGSYTTTMKLQRTGHSLGHGITSMTGTGVVNP